MKDAECANTNKKSFFRFLVLRYSRFKSVFGCFCTKNWLIFDEFCVQNRT